MSYNGEGKKNKLNIMNEITKDLFGYESEYIINTNGIIYKKNNSIIKQHKSKYGYIVVNLTKGKKTKTEYLHRLVAQTFIPNHELQKTVNHIDGNKENNSVLNLEWLSLADNLRHAYRIGLKNSNHSKLNLICTNTNKEYKGVKDACIDFGYSYGHLYKMINGDRVNTTSLKRL